MHPVIKDAMAAIKTTPADLSFINHFGACLSVDIKSIILSIAVLNSSATHTKPMTRIMKSFLILRHKL